MDNRQNQIVLDGITCHLYHFGDVSECVNVPLIAMPSAGPTTLDSHPLVSSGIASGRVSPHVLAVFETGNWDDDLSPWPAPAVGRGGEPFGGRAGDTLNWMLTRLMPALRQHAPQTDGGKKGLIGYSLAGLFAVWALLNTDAFDVYASCSGSLWYDGFAEYFASREPRAPCSVHLSLGDREERTRNPRFARVGDATRQIAAQLKASPKIVDTDLVWHPGGHGGGAADRLAAAQVWMTRR